MAGPTLSLTPYQYLAFQNPYQHFAYFGGVASGKTYTGSQFAIRMIREHPEATGFIGANTYDQLSQATLRELFYWLDTYGFQWVIDCIPPAEWGVKKKFKSYRNILSVLYKGKVVTIFTRVLGDGNPLRGVEFSWYWIDETRDTPQMTHDIILSRMRESDWVKGLMTTTPNGEDWAYQRFVRGNDGSMLYGSMHVPTLEAVNAGIITQNYYNMMRASYSPLMAAQELDAKHVNVEGGRAYYAASERNKQRIAPWGDAFPNPERPLVVGCDFNFTPAPHIWIAGQTGPAPFHNHIHWFGEISQVEASTEHMTKMLLMRYPGFFYRVYGDASGNRGTTSNAGEHDYNQIGMILSEARAGYTIDADQANPRVRDRVENMNARFQNGLGEVRQSYNPDMCPNFDADIRMVGWKKTIQVGLGKLDDGGDCQRTHATDGAGYAVFKLFPPMNRGTTISHVQSALRHSRNAL